MERAISLREQARKLRDIAARSTQHPEIHRRLLALAEQCEQLADSFGDDPPSTETDKSGES
jgi:hypothetical protein